MTVNATMDTMLPTLTPSQMIQGAALQVAAGILGQYLNPLGAGPFSQPMFPALAQVSMGSIWAGGGGCVRIPEPKAQWTASMTGQNTAKIDLGDGYTLNVDERSSEMTILNAKTGETTRIWGDPHVDVDGKHAFDFYGTTTFTLENGTKITINTEQWAGNPNMYVASQVVITKGDNAIIVDGISQNKLGDLSVSMSNNGRAIDAATRDGFTLHENRTGSGWRTESGQMVTQREADVTRPGQTYGPGSTAPSFGEMSSVMSAFLIFGGLFGAAVGDALGTSTHHHRHHHHHRPLV